MKSEDRWLWAHDDKNIEILPQWHPTNDRTIPFTDELVAAKFLGGVFNYSDATRQGCVDSKTMWCDLVRRLPDGKLESRFDLVNSRLDPYVQSGLDIMIVLGSVPWAFVNVTEQACQSQCCQCLPPDNPQEFADWVGELAAHVKQTYGEAYVSRIRWRLGTEANGPRWSDYGKYFQKYLDSYKLTTASIRSVIPDAQVGAANWMSLHQGNDDFEYKFYKAIADDSSVVLDWVSSSQYGTKYNFPGPDHVKQQHKNGPLELQALRDLSNRPNATLEIMEWGILSNEVEQRTNEPSAVGTAWSAASTTTWMCHGVDRIFHWAPGATLRNSTGDGRLVQFYEQHSWNMAILELFIGGRGRFATYDLPQADSNFNHSVAVVESVKDDVYYALVAAVASNRTNLFSTRVSIEADALGADDVVVEQYVMSSERSVVETVIRELADKPGMLQHPDNPLPADFSKMLTHQGMAYAEQPENLERYWQMNIENLKPQPFEGTWSRDKRGRLHLHTTVDAFSVTVLVARPATAISI